MICEYIKSITIEEESKRLRLLRDTVSACGFEPFNEDDLKNRISRDIYQKRVEE